MSNHQATSNSPLCVVVSQPMYFPWVGILEQIKLCDIFVHYDDVQFARGFFNRVQVKTGNGIRWMTVPLTNLHRGQLISDAQLDKKIDWKKSHYDLLKQSYFKAPYLNQMLEIVDDVFSKDYENLAQLSTASIMALARYFGLDENRNFLTSSELEVKGASTQRLLDICIELKAGTYLTGHGAKNYLEHEKFEVENIDVAYIKYGINEYTQLHGDFTPYVTSLDLVAHCGKDGADLISGAPMHWREFIKEL